MVVEIEKEWAAVRGDRILFKAETKDAVCRKLTNQQLRDSTVEIVALPKHV